MSETSSLRALRTSDRVDRGAYLIVVRGDDDRMVDTDICEVVENHYRVRAQVLEPGIAKPSDEIRDDYRAARAALGEWVKGWLNEELETWDLPASAVHFVVAAHGAEVNPVGTYEALVALTEECEDCSGEGYFQDDSHPGCHAITCTTCDGHRRVPLRARPKPRQTEDSVEGGGDRG
jgi:hypothetical protein